jgi:serine/threonine protein kinase/tetratricopeptide (TPR) repeat protein
MSLRSGIKLGPYEILSLLGAGGMGEVYRAKDTRLGREVAVKVLPAEFAADPERLRRFEQEARAAAALNHSNILVLHDLGSAIPPHAPGLPRPQGGLALTAETDEAVHYIVTELLEGETLRDRLRGGAIPQARAVDMGVQIAQGLAAAHEKGIIHRDLKPENLFITRDGRIKILDFGLARLRPEGSLQEEGRSQAVTADIATREGTILGTLGYMAPEQVLGQAVDHRADLFAFGCVLYEMLAGRRAFEGATATDVAAAILREDPQPLPAGIPPALARLVKRCLEKHPQDRFSSAQDLAFTLAAFGQDTDDRARSSRAGSPVRDDGPSIAVLPFANLSADPEQEYFCDGMAEEILNALAHVEALRVVARTSAFAFKGRTEDIRQIGRSLNVGAVLEGSVRKAGNQLRITAQLIDVSTGYHLWSERYDRRAEDVFAIQDEISLAIVDRLKVSLFAGERAAILHPRTNSLEAHEAYLKGLFEWNSMTPEGFARCQELYREAIRLDPQFAPPYAQLADSFTSVAWWADLPPSGAIAQALPLAEKALALDSGLAHAYSVRGHTRAFFLRDLTGGERDLRKAVELAPNSALSQTYLALLLATRGGRDEEAAARARIAVRLDPLSPPVNAWAGILLIFCDCKEEGLGILIKLAASTPNLWMPFYFLSVALAADGQMREAREASERALDLSQASSLTITQAAVLAYEMDDHRRGDELVARLEQRAQSRYVPPAHLARIHLVRGEADEALSLFRKALEAKDPWLFAYLMSSKGSPRDPRVEALIKETLR